MNAINQRLYARFGLRRRATEKAESRPARFWRHFRLLRYARPQWRGLALMVVFMCIGVGFGLIGPWPTKILVDYVLGSHHVPHALHAFFDALPGPNTKLPPS